MINPSILSSSQMNTLKRTRTSILRPSELIEIQGSYWPRILILSESAERRSKTSSKKAGKSSFSPVKVSRRRMKKEMFKQLKKYTPSTTSSIHRPLSPSFEASPNALASISTIDQNSCPQWNSSTSKTKTSSLTGRVVVAPTDNTTKNHPTAQPSSGLKGPRRRKPAKAVDGSR
eukprot:CAMPEP_0172360988 /NCGR_PEP_ID=MMETSP1060-20121228/4900_1 /TAXON_ID=37318 /ORGANISM="Pseudo-nitzschia pungens, Strain cf. cingulata" /LENGTH=173 /DNA_ID=CAMNT_0013083121 /DNA_START=649 /DNA_END=1170 /DNA_ORIENTATION=+